MILPDPDLMEPDDHPAINSQKIQHIHKPMTDTRSFSNIKKYFFNKKEILQLTFGRMFCD